MILWQFQRIEVGDPLSHLLFLLVAEVLGRMLARAAKNGLMEGFV